MTELFSPTDRPCWSNFSKPVSVWYASLSISSVPHSFGYLADWWSCFCFHLRFTVGRKQTLNGPWWIQDWERIGKSRPLAAFLLKRLSPLFSTFCDSYGRCSWWLNFFPHQIDPVDLTELLASFVWCIGHKDNFCLCVFRLTTNRLLSVGVFFSGNWACPMGFSPLPSFKSFILASSVNFLQDESPLCVRA